MAHGIQRKARQPTTLEMAARQSCVSNEIMLGDFEYLNRPMLLRYEEVIERLWGFVGLDDASLVSKEESWQIHGHRSPVENQER